MVYEIIWTLKAGKQFESIVTYLRTEWTERTAENFTKDAHDKIDLLALMPFIGRASENDSSVRRILITRQISLLYSVQEPIIFLLGFSDNRQDPAQNPF